MYGRAYVHACVPRDQGGRVIHFVLFTSYCAPTHATDPSTSLTECTHLALPRHGPGLARAGLPIGKASGAPPSEYELNQRPRCRIVAVIVVHPLANDLCVQGEEVTMALLGSLF